MKANLPGFTAEVSLYNTKGPYLMVGRVTQTDGPIQAAFTRGGGCMAQCLKNLCVGFDDPYCDANCSCICFGHPGKTCWLQ